MIVNIFKPFGPEPCQYCGQIEWSHQCVYAPCKRSKFYENIAKTFNIRYESTPCNCIKCQAEELIAKYEEKKDAVEKK